MEEIKNYALVQASNEGFMRPQAGGYICKIINVEDVPFNENTGKGKYLKIEYDIADGVFKNYYMKQFERWHGSWNARFVRSYKENALGMFKHFINCIENSNAGYIWDWNESGLIGKEVGLVLGEEEYINSAGAVKSRLYVKDVKTVDDINNNNFKVPVPKKIEDALTPSSSFPRASETFEDDLPF